MGFSNVESFMSQQLKVIKELEALIARNEKETAADHGVSSNDIEALKTHVKGLRAICDTATAMAKYYTIKDKPADKKPEKPKAKMKPIPLETDDDTNEDDNDNDDFDFLD